MYAISSQCGQLIIKPDIVWDTSACSASYLSATRDSRYTSRSRRERKGEEKREKERKREEENDYSIEECSIKRTKRLRRCRYRIISFRAMIRKNLLEESHFEGRGGGHGRGSRHISSDTSAITTATTTAWKKGETRLSRAQCLSILLEPP